MSETAKNDWQLARSIFEEALLKPAEERRSHAQKLCRANEDLWNEVESLLDWHERSDSFLEKPAVTRVVDSDERTDQLRPGQRLLHYEIRQLIGMGGMGEVYLAWDTRLHRNVAVKLLRGDLLPHIRTSERLFREARAAALLEHPNICHIYEISEADGFSFIVMQYVVGTTLDELLADGQLDTDTAMDLAGQVADGLAEAHSRGIIHRDIKPANIIVSEKGQAKILDFGLAKFIETETGAEGAGRLLSTGGLMGTVPYMSPEQLRGEPVDAQTDVFSLGSVLFEMFSGAACFNRKNSEETISAILHEEPDWSLISHVLRPLLQRCLVKDKAERYASAGELREAISKIRNHGPIENPARSSSTAPNRTGAVTELTDLETRPLYERDSGGRIVSRSLPPNSQQQILSAIRLRGWRAIAGSALGLVVLFFVAYIAGLGHIFRSFINPAQSGGRPQIFRYYIREDPEDLDPLSGNAAFSGEALSAALFDGLFEIDDAGQPVPSLASSWTASKDATSWVFHLRPEANWSDGTPITAQDFVYSWKRALSAHLNLYSASQLYLLKGGQQFNEGKTKDIEVRALDDHTLGVTLTEPAVYFPKLLTLSIFRPVPRHAIERWGGKMWITPEHIVTSGAFRIREKTGDRLTLERNPFFWDAANTRLEQIDFCFAPSTVVDPAERSALGMTLYDQGDVDAVAFLPKEALEQFKDKSDLISVNTGIEFILVNSEIKPLGDPRVRKALSLAIDRQQFFDNGSTHSKERSLALVPPMPGYDGVPTGSYFNPDAARKSLADAGFPEGKGFPKIEFFYNANENRRRTAQLLQASWSRELGIQVDLREEGFRDFLVKVGRGEFNGLAVGAWVPDGNDPYAFLTMLRSNGEHGQFWKNSKFDEKLRDANAEFDFQRRSALMSEAESMALSDLPIIPLKFSTWSLLRKSYVKNFSPATSEQINLREVYLQN